MKFIFKAGIDDEEAPPVERPFQTEPEARTHGRKMLDEAIIGHATESAYVAVFREDESLVGAWEWSAGGATTWGGDD